MNVLGHMQQGGSPSPFDRNLGTKMAAKAADWLITQIKVNSSPDGTVNCVSPDTVALLGLIRRQYKFTPVLQLESETDFK